jgi:hypothetical protein
MANGFYLKGMKHFAFGDIVWKAAGGSTIKASLIDAADYTVNLSTHEFLSDVAGAGIEETGTITLTDAADDGIVDGSDVVLVATAGDQCEGILVYKDTGVAGTSPLLFWWDTGVGGLPVTLGGDVTISWDNGANKIAKI